MNLFEPITRFWKSASSLSRALAVMGAAAPILALIVFLAKPEPREMSPLYGELSAYDAGEVVEFLKTEKVTYELADQGQTILVPRAVVHELRVRMAQKHIPRGGGSVGFEQMDKATALMPQALQKMNMQRALQGELERTLTQIPSVRTARVHLSMPDDSIFAAKRTSPTGAVYLDLVQGHQMTPKEASDITFLVAGSVPGLEAERVTIHDRQGRLLSSAPITDANGYASRALEISHDFEARAERRIIELLEPVVGVGKVVARVTADMDLSRTNEESKEFDPDNATVKRETKSSQDSNQESKDPRLAAGASSNVPGGANGAVDTTRSTSKQEVQQTTIEYEVPSITRHTVKAIGELNRLSIAILVDSNAMGQATPPAGDGAVVVPGSPEKAAAPRGPSVTALAELVKKAIGYSEKRGDQMEVLFVPFTQADAVAMAELPAPAEASAAIPGWVPVTVVCFVGFGALVGSMIATERRRRREAEEAEARRKREEEAARENAEALDDGMSPARLKERIRAATAENIPGTMQHMKALLA